MTLSAGCCDIPKHRSSRDDWQGGAKESPMQETIKAYLAALEAGDVGKIVSLSVRPSVTSIPDVDSE